MAQAGISANRLELLQIADAVAREKSIDRKIVIAAMEDAIQKAAKSRYGAENDIRCEIDPKTGETKLTRVLQVVDAVENDVDAGHARRRQAPQSRRQGRRPDRRDAAAPRLRPRGGAERQAGDRAEGARGRARAPVRRVQGPRGRDRQRHRQARRVRQRHRRSRPRRGHHPPRRDDPARERAPRRPHPRLHLRRAARAARAADLPLARAARVHVQAVRAGGAGDLRRHRADQVGGARSGLPGQDRRHLQGQLDRSGRRLRRHARPARAGGGRRAAGREGRHHPVEPGRGDLHRQRAGAGRGHQGGAGRGVQPHRGGGAREPAVARHRPARPERAARLAAHRLGDRHPDRAGGVASGARRSSPSARSCSWRRSTSTR